MDASEFGKPLAVTVGKEVAGCQLFVINLS
jgi:hypothetical protein